MENREKLIEQYDDAVFALLMDDYAEEAGAELLEQFQDALDAGLVPEIPEELDLRCEAAIDAEFRGRKKRAWLRSLCRGLVRVIFALFLLIGLVLRTAYDIWKERRARKHSPREVPELHTPESPEDEQPIFLTL